MGCRVLPMKISISDRESLDRPNRVCSKSGQRSNIPAHTLVLRYADIKIFVQGTHRQTFEGAARQTQIQKIVTRGKLIGVSGKVHVYVGCKTDLIDNL